MQFFSLCRDINLIAEVKNEWSCTFVPSVICPYCMHQENLLCFILLYLCMNNTVVGVLNQCYKVCTWWHCIQAVCCECCYKTVH
jgi:hypothetical protein